MQRLVGLSYLAYAAGFSGLLAAWTLFLSHALIQVAVEAGRLQVSWRGVADALARNAEVAVALPAGATLLGLCFALVPQSDLPSLERSHRGYQQRLAPFAGLSILLVLLAEGRMGSYDADLGGLASLGVSIGLLIFAWRRYRRGVPVSTPPGWQLALAAALLMAIAGALVLWLLRDGMTRLF
ncbi:MAG TPA: hypothetical protein EYH07_02160 [Kiloniellaceae bacterium]|nr:hypothetical protein [Kiloniellaceae bacterium]HIP77255.1 hypothetical protein [Kiloniellaceae bacterium]